MGDLQGAGKRRRHHQVGTWPPVLGIFEKSLSTGKFDEDMVLDDGSKLKIAKVHFCWEK